MDILIISPGIKPIPATKGGAVETLIEELIRDKKITSENYISIYTIYDSDAEKISYDIKCNFNYIYTNGKFYKIKKIIRHFINRLLPIYIGNQYISSVIKDMKNKNKRYDLIIVENMPDFGRVLQKVKKQARLVLHLHNDYINENTKHANKVIDCYDKILTVSKYIAKRVNKINKKAQVLYNGIDIDKFSNNELNKERMRKKYDFSANDFIFMYSGRIVKEKGINEMIEAFCNLKDDKCKLLIVGETEIDKKFYKKMLTKSQISGKNIIFYGHAEYSKIQELYGVADVGIIPSICNEAFGLTVIEFLASKVPVIISDKGAMKEIVNIEGECAKIAKCDSNYVKNLEDNMRYYLNISKDEIKNLRENCIKNANKFTKEKYTKEFCRVLEEEKYER